MLENFNKIKTDSIKIYLKILAFSKITELFGVSEEIGLKKEHLTAVLMAIGKMSNPHKYTAFKIFVDSIEKTKILNNYYPLIKTHYLLLLENIDKLDNKMKYEAFSKLLDVSKEAGFMKYCYKEIDALFLTLMENINKLDYYNRYKAFSKLLTGVKKNKLIKEKFPILLDSISKIHNYGERAFSELLKISKETGLIKKHLPAFLDIINKLHDYDKYECFFSLVISIKDTDLWSENYSRFEILFLILLDNVVKIGKKKKNKAFSKLIEVAKKTRLINDHLPTLLKAIDVIDENNNEYVFEALVQAWRDMGLKKEYFLDFVNVIEKMGYHDYFVFSKLVKIAKEMDSMKEFFPILSEAIDEINNDADKYEAFETLLNIARREGLTTDYFPVLLESVKVLGEYKYRFFLESCETAKEMGLMEMYHAEIKRLFLTLLGDIDKLDDKDKYEAFFYLNLAIEGSELTDELYSLNETQFLNLIDITNNLNKADAGTAFNRLTGLPMDTKLMQNHFLALLGVLDKLYNYEKYSDFNYLLKRIKGTNLFDDYFYNIEKFYLDLLNNIDELPNKEKNKAIYRMIKVFKSNEVWSKYFSLIKTKFIAILNQFDKLPDSSQKFDYADLNSVIKDTDLEKDIAVKEWKEKYRDLYY